MNLPEAHWPTHAYIPGQNERHPEGAFELLRQSVGNLHDPEQLAQTDAFKAGLRFLQAGFYWEAHEVLEPVWMALDGEETERKFVQGLIQLANGFLKVQMNRPGAARRLVAKARALVPEPSDEAAVMSLSTGEVHQWIDRLEVAVAG